MTGRPDGAHRNWAHENWAHENWAQNQSDCTGDAPGSEPWLSQMSLEWLLTTMAQRRAAPAAGSAAGWAMAIAAALVAKAARLSHRQMADANNVAEEADRMRGNALELAEADAAAVTAMIQKSVGYKSNQSKRDASYAQSASLEEAVKVPQQIQEAGDKLAQLAERIATEGNPRLYPDAVTARMLAQTAGQIAQTLVASNEG